PWRARGIAPVSSTARPRFRLTERAACRLASSGLAPRPWGLFVPANEKGEPQKKWPTHVRERPAQPVRETCTALYVIYVRAERRVTSRSLQASADRRRRSRRVASPF